MLLNSVSCVCNTFIRTKREGDYYLCLLINILATAEKIRPSSHPSSLVHKRSNSHIKWRRNVLVVVRWPRPRRARIANLFLERGSIYSLLCLPCHSDSLCCCSARERTRELPQKALAPRILSCVKIHTFPCPFLDTLSRSVGETSPPLAGVCSSSS